MPPDATAIRRGHDMPFGAMVLASGGTRFRLWAPAAGRVDLVIDSATHHLPIAMEHRDGGWYERIMPECGAGTRYGFLIDGRTRVPDPASRAQPDDVHGPSVVIDPRAFAWPDGDWRGRAWEETVFYEIHVGAFAPGGSFDAVAARLDDLADLGVTAIELMPVADFPGRRNWGYDGCYPFAPDSAYGHPDRLKSLVAAAHARRIMVFMDVVYNHFGPEGNYLHLYAPAFFTERHSTPWGKAIDFARGGRAVRDFFIHNALYWLEEFHIDGLRLDAVHAIFDESEPHILVELAETVHARFGGRRHIHLVLENDDNAARHLTRDGDGRPRWYAAQWNDDIHHACHVLATGETAGYYADYAVTPVHHLGRALTEGFAYQGAHSAHRGAPRGEPSTHLPLTAFVSFLQNHDQIGNRAFGDRIGEGAAVEAIEALAAILLLAPSVPLLFMGEEQDAREPFPFFCDFGPDLADSVREGRHREFARFPAFQDEAARARIPDPLADETFARAILSRSDRTAPHARARRTYYRALLALRRVEIVPRLRGLGGRSGSFQTWGDQGLCAAWRLGDGARLSLRANLGVEALDAPPEAPPGRLLFATHPPSAKDPAQGAWPPWSVTWFIDTTANGAAR